MRSWEKLAAKEQGRHQQPTRSRVTSEASQFHPGLHPATLSPAGLLTMQRQVGNTAVTGYLAAARVPVQREDDEELLEEDMVPPLPKRSLRSKVADQAKSFGGGLAELGNLAGLGRIWAGFQAGRDRRGPSGSKLGRAFYRAAKRGDIPVTEAESIPQMGAGYVAGRVSRAAADGPDKLWNLVVDVINDPKALWGRIVSVFSKQKGGAVNFGPELEPEL